MNLHDRHKNQGACIPGIGLTQSLDVQRPLLLILHEIGNIATGRDSIPRGPRGNLAALHGDVAHSTDRRSE